MNIKNDNKYNIPEFLIEMLNNQYKKEDVNRIIKGYLKKRSVSLRVNTLKSSKKIVTNKLEKNGIKYENVIWSKEALIIKNAEEKEIQEMEIYKNGEIYLQSLSSMLPPIILNPKENTDILDMCAAPRGKNNSNCSNYK